MSKGNTFDVMDSEGKTRILPCPFCGGSASAEPRAGDTWIVRCNARFLPNPTGKLCPINGRTRGDSTLAEAVAQWNTRT